MKNPILILTLAFALLAAGCGDQVEQQPAPDAGSAPTADTAPAAESASAPAARPDVWRGQVAETMDAGGYTYVLLDVEGNRRWVAGPTTSVSVGDNVMMMPGMEMRDFTSKTLDRTFDVIWFVGAIEQDDGHDHTPSDGMPTGMGGSASAHTTLEDAGVAGVEKLAGGVTVAEIYAGTGDLAGKPVKVRGRVVKFTPNIMGTNWVHLQDGTGSPGEHDLTVTTKSSLQVGDLVVIEGTLAVDRDFGAGYRYPVIIEEATVTKE